MYSPFDPKEVTDLMMVKTWITSKSFKERVKRIEGAGEVVKYCCLAFSSIFLHDYK